MEVTISPAGDGQDEDAESMASLRAWLEDGGGSEWDLKPEEPASHEYLGFGVDEVCAVLSALEGLPGLIYAIRGWFTTREEPEPVTISVGSHKITIDPAADAEPVTITVGSQTITVASSATGTEGS